MADLILLDNVERNPNTILTVGTFDGVHAGHRAILDTVVNKSKERNARSVLVSFDPHPRNIINPGDAGIKLLTTIKERSEILNELGIDQTVVIPFDRDFSLLSSEEFIREIIYDQIGVSEFVIGYDHHFGHDREGTIETIERLGKELGFDSYVVSKKEIGEQAVSSTAIRKAISEEGDVKKAAEFLQRPYRFNGTVIHGEKRGKKIGYPTANIKPAHPQKVIPKDGVYAVRMRVMDRWFKGMMNIGTRPTFEENVRTLEVNLFDFDENIYGKEVQVRFYEYLRDEVKFDGVEELIQQLKQDENDARKMLKEH